MKTEFTLTALIASLPRRRPRLRIPAGSGRHGIPSIGSWLLRGENGAVTLTLGSLTRLRSNPFWMVVNEEVGTLVAADLGKQH